MVERCLAALAQYKRHKNCGKVRHLPFGFLPCPADISEESSSSLSRPVVLDEDMKTTQSAERLQAAAAEFRMREELKFDNNFQLKTDATLHAGVDDFGLGLLLKSGQIKRMISSCA